MHLKSLPYALLFWCESVTAHPNTSIIDYSKQQYWRRFRDYFLHFVDGSSSFYCITRILPLLASLTRYFFLFMSAWCVNQFKSSQIRKRKVNKVKCTFDMIYLSEIRWNLCWRNATKQTLRKGNKINKTLNQSAS